MKKRVVITGLGPVSPIGRERETFWHSLVRGVSGIKLIERFASSPYGYRTHIGGEISDFDPAPYLPKKISDKFSRFTNMAIISASLALADTHLQISAEEAGRIGIILGTGIGGLEKVEEQALLLKEEGLSKVNILAANSAIPHAAAGEVSVYLGLKGLNYTVSTGCSASANALGAAFDAIRLGRADVILSGGAETPFTDVIFATFDASKQMSAKNKTPDKASSPYDLNRDGFVLAEGSATIILEELEHALARGAYIYGEVIGFGSSADAYDSYRMEAEGLGMAAAMESALRDAEITPYEIDYICSHGSGSLAADKKETKAIKHLFRDQAANVPISTIKSVMGMPFGASTGFQAIASALMLEKQMIIPTMNYTTPDPDLNLDYVPNKARPAILNYIMINSMGLGGNNAVLILKKFSK